MRCKEHSRAVYTSKKAKGYNGIPTIPEHTRHRITDECNMVLLTSLYNAY